MKSRGPYSKQRGVYTKCFRKIEQKTPLYNPFKKSILWAEILQYFYLSVSME